jgi:hypothetical protein
LGNARQLGVFLSTFFLLEQKETKIQERFKMVAAHHGLKAFSMRSALPEQRNSNR